VGLVALKLPVGENGSIASATAIVQFDEELPAHSASTNARVFKAAESVFRQRRRFDETDVGVKESILTQPIFDGVADIATHPDGISDGAKVWLFAA
jgi:hypothetical protein